MRFVTFREAGACRVGVVKENGVVDLTKLMGAPSLKALIEAARLAEAEAVAREAAPTLAFGEIKLDLPLPDPAKIICVGVNYANRNAEYKDNTEPPKFPSLFIRTPLSFAPHGEPVLIPLESEQLDYEGEIVLVIGKGGRRIPRSEAWRHVAGLTIMNEGTIRDWVRHAKFNVTQGKNFDRSGGLGPWIETDMTHFDPTNIAVTTWVNGERRQHDTTASMSFPIDYLIEYISLFTTLLPGDLIASGTPVGAGARFDPPIWLREGDVVEVEVEGVGRLRNPVAKEKAA